MHHHPADRRHPVLRDCPALASIRVLPGVLALAALWLAGPTVGGVALDPETQGLLVEAVTAAADLDAYHARCRGDVSGRRMENLNKLIASKLRLTVLTVQDDLFPERNYRRAQERLEREFIERLQQTGGCAGAKGSDLPERLRQRYEQAIESIQRLP